MYVEAHDFERAAWHAQASVERSRDLGSRRFESESLLFLAWTRELQGQRDVARALYGQALQLAQDHLSYCGPCIMVGLATLTDDENERARYLSEGEALLSQGAIAFNHYYFYRRAIELALKYGDPIAAEGYLARCEAFFSKEPIPAMRFIGARAQALIAVARGDRSATLVSTLQSLARDARSIGLIGPCQEIDDALATLGARSQLD
jgi:hypothetical protein